MIVRSNDGAIGSGQGRGSITDERLIPRVSRGAQDSFEGAACTSLGASRLIGGALEHFFVGGADSIGLCFIRLNGLTVIELTTFRLILDLY